MGEKWGPTMQGQCQTMTGAMNESTRHSRMAREMTIDEWKDHFTALSPMHMCPPLEELPGLQHAPCLPCQIEP